MLVGFNECLKHLRLIRKTNRRDINAAEDKDRVENRCNAEQIKQTSCDLLLVLHKHLAYVFLPLHLSSTCKLCYRTGGSGLGLLAARVAVHLRVHDEDVHVIRFESFDMIQSSESDIVCLRDRKR